MILESPFIGTGELFECTSDYALALAYFAKSSNEIITIDDIERLIKYFKVNIKYSKERFKPYILNANYTDLSNQELRFIKKTFSLYENEEDILVNYEGVIHHGTGITDKIDILIFAFAIDLMFYGETKAFNILESTIKYIFKNNSEFSFRKEKDQMIAALGKINDDYLKDSITDYFLDNTIIDIFQIMEIETIDELKKLNDDVLYIILCRNIEEYIKFFEKLSQRKKKNVAGLLNVIKLIKQNVLIKKRKDVFYRRYGINCKKQTLEEISYSYDVTRERIRQIQKKTVTILELKWKKVFNSELDNAIEQQKINAPYIEYSKVRKFINDDEISELLLALIELLCDDKSYDEYLDIVCYNYYYDTLINNKLLMIPIVVPIKDLPEYDDLSQRLIRNNNYYRITASNCYLKVGNSTKDLYLSLIDEIYPNGFTLNDNFCKSINDEMKNRYGIEPLDFIGYKTRFEHWNTFWAVDRSYLMNKNYAAKLTDDLRNKILKYLYESNQGAIYYVSIFKNFENELLSIGINNRYHLKSALDEDLPMEFKSKRDYIAIGDKNTSISNEFDALLDSVHGVFDASSFKEKFPGVADYSIYNNISGRDDVLQYDYGSKFLKVDPNLFDKEFDKLIIDEIENTFKAVNFPVITSTKIYSRMRILHPDDLSKYSFLDNHFVFYSYITRRINCYSYFRPYISKEKSIMLQGRMIINSYIESQEYFNKKILDSFLNKMQLSLYNSSYMDFMIDESDMFVQINVDTCVKKKYIAVDEQRLERIKSELDYYINSFGEINTINPLCFDDYPYIGYAWSKYLLVGVVRSYLADDYIIEYTHSMHNVTDFIIRRMNK